MRERSSSSVNLPPTPTVTTNCADQRTSEEKRTQQSPSVMLSHSGSRYHQSYNCYSCIIISCNIRLVCHIAL